MSLYERPTPLPRLCDERGDRCCGTPACENAGRYFAHFIAPDAHGDTTLWRTNPDRPDYPHAIVRLIDLPETARFLWPLIVEAVGA